MPERAESRPVRPPRDLWAWTCVLAPLVLLARAWGAPLGEPVADDLYFLHRAQFGPVGWLDGFGSPLYWRPFGRQAYFLTFGPLILAWPFTVALLHSGLLALATWLIHRTLRRHWPAPLAAAAATFPALAEATRPNTAMQRTRRRRASRACLWFDQPQKVEQATAEFLGSLR